MSDTIEVVANSALLQTERADTGRSIDAQIVEELPLVVGGALRTAFDLAALTPEAKNLGGGQATSYGTSLDGISTNTTRALSMS